MPWPLTHRLNYQLARSVASALILQNRSVVALRGLRIFIRRALKLKMIESSFRIEESFSRRRKREFCSVSRQPLNSNCSTDAAASLWNEG